MLTLPISLRTSRSLRERSAGAAFWWCRCCATVLQSARSSSREAGSFDDKIIGLLKTFADQAVIAIENVRLFEAEQARTHDLTESLKQQTATAEVLKVISRSAFDLQKVLDALLASACRLCEADIGTIRYLDGNAFRLATTFGCKPEWI